MKDILHTAMVGAAAGGGMGLSRVHSDPDGWGQVFLGVVLFGLVGAAYGAIIVGLRAVARRRRHPL